MRLGVRDCDGSFCLERSRGDCWWFDYGLFGFVDFDRWCRRDTPGLGRVWFRFWWVAIVYMFDKLMVLGQNHSVLFAQHFLLLLLARQLCAQSDDHSADDVELHFRGVQIVCVGQFQIDVQIDVALNTFGRFENDLARRVLVVGRILAATGNHKGGIRF